MSKKLFVTVLTLTILATVPALGQDYGGGAFCGIPEGCDLDGDGIAETPAGTPTGAAGSQYDAPGAGNETGETVVAAGTIEEQGMTTYMYGTHVLMDENGDLLFALLSNTVALDGYVGERVTLHGTRVPGYQNGAIEGGPDLINVTRVEDGSTTQPPTDKPGTDTSGTDSPETSDSGGPHSGSGDAAATGVLPDTGGTSVAPLLAISAILLGSALLVHRIVG